MRAAELVEAGGYESVIDPNVTRENDRKTLMDVALGGPTSPQPRY